MEGNKDKIMNMIKSKGLKLFMLSVVVFGFLFSIFNTTVDKVGAADVRDYSLYHRASEVATTFGNQMAPDVDNDGKSPWIEGGFNAGSAGGYLGYSRDLSEDDEGIMGWVTSRFSANTMDYDFKQLEMLGGSSKLTGQDGNRLLGYGLYGAKLQELGLVDSTDADGSGLGSIGRWFYSTALLVAYWFARIVPFIFETILKLLTIFNPFTFFFGIADGLSSVQIPIIKEVAEYISNIYMYVQRISIYVIVPVLIGITAISVFMFRGGPGKKVSRLFVRVFMIFAGIPLIGATYTSIIEDLSDNMDMSTSYVDYIIHTQLVDTENWVKNSRLAPPINNPIYVDYSSSSGEVKGSTVVSRDMVLEINQKGAGKSQLAHLNTDVGSSSDLNDMIDSSKAGEENTSINNSTMDLINRYKKGERFSASDFEGYVKAQLDKDDNISDEAIASMFDPNIKELSSDDYADLFRHKNKAVDKFEGIEWSIYNFGRLGIANNGSDQFTLVTRNGNISNKIGKGSVRDSMSLANTGMDDHYVGLSPLAMYNFLNTEFELNSMKVYSPKTSSSGWASNDYASVTKVNHGFSGFIFGVESLVLISISAFLGLMYAIGLIKVVIASIPRILSSVFGTAFGSMAMITKLLVSTIVLVVELIGSILLYQIFDMLILGVFRGVDNLIVTPSTLGIGIVNDIQAIVTIMLSLGVAYFGLKNRTALGKMMEEVTTDTITKLMGGLDNSLNEGNRFHNPQGVQQGAQDGTVLGDDGGVGTRGSGTYASKVAGGHDPDSKEGRGLMDAIRETRGQEEALKRAKGEDYVEPEKGELEKDALERYGAYKGAALKDEMANTLGGFATAASALGVAGLDGGETARLEDRERAERRGISDAQRGMGKYSAPETSGDTDSSVEKDIDEPTSLENHEAEMSTINQTPDGEILNGDIDESVAMDNDGGTLESDQDEYGSVMDSVGIGEEAVLNEDDAHADQQMLEAFGDDAEEINMDDATDHPPMDVLSDDYDGYVDDLGTAAMAQTEQAEHHVEQADKQEAMAERYQEIVDDLSAKDELTADEQSKLDQAKNNVEKHGNLAEQHRNQARTAGRKGMKLADKQRDAAKQRQKAVGVNEHGENQAESVQKAQKYAQAQKTLNTKKGKRDQMKRELDQMQRNNPTDKSGIKKKQSQLNALDRQIKSDESSVGKLEAQALDALPQDNFDEHDLHSMDQGQLDNYAQQHNLSPEQMGQRLIETPTREEYDQARLQAASDLAEMGSKVGSSRQETFNNQKTFAQQSIDSAFGGPIENEEQIPQQISDKSQQLNALKQKQVKDKEKVSGLRKLGADVEADRLENSMGTTASQIKQVDNDINRLKQDQRKVNQRKAYSSVMSGALQQNQRKFKQQQRKAKTANKMQRKVISQGGSVDSRLEKQSPRMQSKYSYNLQNDMKPGGKLETKAQRMRNMNVSTQEEYNQAYNEAYAEYNEADNQIKQVNRRIRRAEQHGRTKEVSDLKGQRVNLRRNLAKQERIAKAKTNELRKNVSGLYYEAGYEPKNKALGGRITGDISRISKVAQDFNKNSLMYNKIRRSVGGDISKLSNNERKQYEQIVKSVDTQRDQLKKAGIPTNMFENQANRSQLTKLLGEEWNLISRGKR